MKLQIKLQEQDFVDFQLFTASQSDRINKKKRNGWLISSLLGLVFTGLFIFENNLALIIYCGVFSVLSLLFYPNYFIWRYKKHYQKFVKENYINRFGVSESLEFTQDSILYSNKTGDGKIILSEIERIDETQKHFFVKVSSGLSIIIPKSELESREEFKSKLNELDLQITDQTNWKWR